MPYERGPNPNRMKVDLQRLALVDSSQLAVTLAEMKLDLRADSNDEDETITRQIRGATDYFEARTGWRLTPARYRALIGGGEGVCFGPVVTIERGPLIAIESMEVYNSTSKSWDVVSPVDFEVEERGRQFDILWDTAALANLPFPTSIRPYPFRLNFTAGFDAATGGATSAAGLPEDGMVLSLKSLVATWYQSREAGGAAGNWSGADPAKDFLLGAYRQFW